MPLYKIFGGTDRQEQMANTAVFTGLVIVISVVVTLAIFLHSIIVDEDVDTQARIVISEVSTTLSKVSTDFSIELIDVIDDLNRIDLELETLETKLLELELRVHNLE